MSEREGMFIVMEYLLVFRQYINYFMILFLLNRMDN